MFTRKKNPAPAPAAAQTAARAALISAAAALDGATQRAELLRSKVAEFENAIEAEQHAHSAVQLALSNAATAEAIEATSTAVENCGAAAGKAAAARTALPHFRRELERAEAEVGELMTKKAKAVSEVLIEFADATTARAYREAFDNTCRLCAEMTGIAQGLARFGTHDLIITHDPPEAPRFAALPSLVNSGSEFSPFLKRRIDISRDQIAAQWFALAQRLADDPGAPLELAPPASTPRKARVGRPMEKLRHAAETAAMVAVSVVS